MNCRTIATHTAPAGEVWNSEAMDGSAMMFIEPSIVNTSVHIADSPSGSHVETKLARGLIGG